MLACCHGAHDGGEPPVDCREFVYDVTDRVIGFYHLDAAKRFFGYGDHLAQLFLCLTGASSQAFDDEAYDESREGKHTQHEYGQTSRYGYQSHEIAYYEGRLFERYLQCVGDAELNDVDVGRQLGDDVAFAFVREETHVEPHDIAIQCVA